MQNFVVVGSGIPVEAGVLPDRALLVRIRLSSR